ncbi:sensory box histidine kinase/response regulator [Ruegeria pomeroyi DSS-3]|uniref:histidine kinase n=2 Tax=Ruegeria pomeroyi TaxID=89184 RepID=Q5LWV8_RUEPO|nr:PAS domain-containing hybrid sensor histidine kinase/response regulator [Ruegeria pomeroyi]AAV93489.1 sensory box histidine kinase/response regulator [Ruegeria pomeroyi DSS-3]NVK96553.1 PAS domain S-box protein [Ruegeria pomeroyi]
MKTGFWIALVLVLIGYSALLGREAMVRLDTLSTAASDDIRWNMSQLEVELLRLQSAALKARDGGQGDIQQLRTRFDIFYSRTQIVLRGALYDQAREIPEVQERLQSLRAFLAESVPIIDAPEPILADRLPELAHLVEQVSPEVRDLALTIVNTSARAADTQRLKVSETLRRLALSVLGLLVALTIVALLLLRLYRSSQVVSAEKEAVKSRFEAAVKSALDAVLVVDTEGHIIEFNGGAEAMFGYSRSEALGQPMSDLIIPPHYRARHEEGMRRFREHGTSRVVGRGHLRLEGMRKSGEVFPIELSISLAETSDQLVFISFLRDITNRLKTEDDLREARDTAQAGAQAKAQLLTVMSHEMRTPLNGILGSLDLMERDELSPKQVRLVRAIRVSGELLLTQVNRVLDLSRLESGMIEFPKEPFALLPMVRRLTESLTAAAEERGNRLQTTLVGDDPGVVLGNRIALQQALVNLLGNAIKFTRNGEISLEVERLNDDRMIEFRISDTGLGIPAKDIERIFDEFVTIDTAYARENPGTGLGLSITRRLVWAMGGEIEVESIEHEGSLFLIRLPLEPGEAVELASEKERGQPEPGPLKGKRVLVIEDNDINRMLLLDMLEEFGCQVVLARDGFEGVAAAKSARYDLLLVDISMPGKDGLETLREIRAQEGPNGPVRAIAITANVRDEDKERFAAAGFDGFLAKPISMLQLQEMLSGLLLRPEAEAERSTAREFIRRFGMAEYQRHLLGMVDALHAVCDDLANTELSETLKARVHEQAGSAAILGRADLHSLLQEIEATDAADWPARRGGMLDRLKTELARTRAVSLGG